MNLWRLCKALVFFEITSLLIIAQGAFAQNSDPLLVSKTLDRMFQARWSAENIRPARLADDAEFFRRIHLDVCGVIPNEEDVMKFLRNKSPQKRLLAIEAVLSSDRFAENWATVWEKILLGRGQLPRDRAGRIAMNSWLKARFSENVPYDEWVYDLITATGASDEVGAVHYFVKNEFKPENLAGRTSQIFLGIQIQCTQCHDDRRTEEWKMEDFWGMAAFFSQTRGRRIREEGRRNVFLVGDFAKRRQIRETLRGELITVFPKFLDESEEQRFLSKRRTALAEWMTSPDNPWFAQEAVNRLWGHLMGRGLVHPVGDLYDGNPPSHPEVLEVLTNDFRKHGFDYKRSMKVILNSSTYQRASSSVPTSQKMDPENRTFFRARLKPLGPEQLFNSILMATNISQELKQRAKNSSSEQARNSILRRFVFVFENDEMQEVTDFEETIPQALMMLNDEVINRGVLARPKSALLNIARSKGGLPDKITRLYLRTLGRIPTSEEKTTLSQYVMQRIATGSVNIRPSGPSETAQIARAVVKGDRYDFLRKITDRSLQRGKKGQNARSRQARPVIQALEDVLWALINSSEFIFNH